MFEGRRVQVPQLPPSCFGIGVSQQRSHCFSRGLRCHPGQLLWQGSSPCTAQVGGGYRGVIASAKDPATAVGNPPVHDCCSRGRPALFQVINQRYLKTSIVITTNRPVGAWGEILGDTTVAAAMLDRLLHRSVVVTLDGASYRLRNHAVASNELRRVTTGTNLR